jgi:hypothetical protein
LDRTVLAMGLLRFLSGLVEIAGAIACLRYDSVSAALRVNSLIGLAGPVFFLIGGIGFVSVSSQLHPPKLAALVAGMLLVLWGTAGA